MCAVTTVEMCLGNRSCGRWSARPVEWMGKNTAHWFGSSSTAAAAAALRKEPDTLSDWFWSLPDVRVWSPAFGSRSAAVDGRGPQRCSGGCRFRWLSRGRGRRCNRHQSPRRSWTHVSLNAQQASSHQSSGAPSMFLFLVSGLSEPPSPPRGPHIRRAELPRGSLSGFRWRIKSLLICGVMSNLAATAQVSAAGMQPLQTFELPGGFRGGASVLWGVKARERMMQVVILGYG